uniref:(northern house mosquito) hypothetical protein n=1 Tax=Culex pipiens TaxID=7175 RepID=A0A8D8D0N5_CULPI
MPFSSASPSGPCVFPDPVAIFKFFSFRSRSAIFSSNDFLLASLRPSSSDLACSIRSCKAVSSSSSSARIFSSSSNFFISSSRSIFLSFCFSSKSIFCAVSRFFNFSANASSFSSSIMLAIWQICSSQNHFPPWVATSPPTHWMWNRRLQLPQLTVCSPGAIFSLQVPHEASAESRASSSVPDIL